MTMLIALLIKMSLEDRLKFLGQVTFTYSVSLLMFPVRRPANQLCEQRGHWASICRRERPGQSGGTGEQGLSLLKEDRVASHSRELYT